MKPCGLPLLATLAFAPLAFAADPEPSPAPTSVQAPAIDEKISVDFPDEDNRVILRQVADQLGLNLVIPGSLQGRTTLKLRNVTWRQLFDAVLSPVNHAFVEEGNIIRIVSREELAQEPMVTEIIPVLHARAADLAPIIRGLVDEAAGGKVLVDARTNALIVTARPSRLGEARPLAASLDR